MPEPGREPIREIIVVSDGTGKTAEGALRAALLQFENQNVRIQVRAGVRSSQGVLAAVDAASAAGAVVVHTVVSKALRDLITTTGRLHNVETIDLMGPLLAQLSGMFSVVPSEKPGLYHELNRAYFQRIEAVEFALRHDDGQRVEELEKAEIVLVGVSRTFKTPVSIYLAFRGWMAANVPLVPEVTPPGILKKLDPQRVFCLLTRPDLLAGLRRVRGKHLGGAAGNYADPDQVERELAFARRFVNSPPRWSTVDVSNKPVEEIASEILEHFKHSEKTDPPSESNENPGGESRFDPGGKNTLQ